MTHLRFTRMSKGLVNRCFREGNGAGSFLSRVSQVRFLPGAPQLVEIARDPRPRPLVREA
jgi:hypothetical protein